MITNKLRKLASMIIYPHKYSSDAYVKYLRKKGAIIGENTFFFHPSKTRIDENRAPYIIIGSGCSITAGVSILCHDFSWTVFRKSHREILPDPGKPVEIGDNVFIGWDAIIIGPVKIGSNVIIGAHSVVTKDIPDNSVVAGNPARVIRSLEEHYRINKDKLVDNAVFRARFVSEKIRRGKIPTKEDMGWFNILWLDRNKESEAFLRTLSFKADDIDEVIRDFYNTEKIYISFDHFLEIHGLNQ